jgi:hypothetical protein
MERLRKQADAIPRRDDSLPLSGAGNNIGLTRWNLLGGPKQA